MTIPRVPTLPSHSEPPIAVLCLPMLLRLLTMASLSLIQVCAVGQEKKRNIPMYFNTNYHTEMKLVPIIMDYCLLQFDDLKFFVGDRLHGEGVSV